MHYSASLRAAARYLYAKLFISDGLRFNFAQQRDVREVKQNPMKSIINKFEKKFVNQDLVVTLCASRDYWDIYPVREKERKKHEAKLYNECDALLFWRNIPVIAAYHLWTTKSHAITTLLPYDFTTCNYSSRRLIPQLRCTLITRDNVDSKRVFKTKRPSFVPRGRIIPKYTSFRAFAFRAMSCRRGSSLCGFNTCLPRLAIDPRRGGIAAILMDGFPGCQ